jgi:LL-diaminopimelate aminotransferase
MTGWRIGFAVGNAEIIGALGRVKTNIDSGLFEAIQRAGIVALTGDQGCTDEMRAVYRKRRDALVSGLKEAGINVSPPKGTFYVFAPTPNGKSSTEFCSELLEKTGVVVTPGVGFGEEGEGFFRCALTVSVERIEEAVRRIKAVL